MDRDWIDRLAHDLSATRAELLGLALLVVGGIVLAVLVVGRVEGSAVADDPAGAPGLEVTPPAVDGAAGDVTGSDPGTPGGQPGEAVGPATGPPTGDVVVHVTGAVASPGVRELPAGSRLVDAVEAAGGVTDAAHPDVLNLAAPLVDGQRLHVPTRAEVAAAASARPSPGPSLLPGESGGGDPVVAGEGASPGLDPTTGRPPTAAPSTGPTTGAGTIDLNLASAIDLEELPGVGPVLAGRIVDWREQHDGFTSVGQLRDVTGIGEKTFQSLAPLVVVS